MILSDVMADEADAGRSSETFVGLADETRSFELRIVSTTPIHETVVDVASRQQPLRRPGHTETSQTHSVNHPDTTGGGAFRVPVVGVLHW